MHSELIRARVCLKNDLINFCSNDYLGLSTHPELIAAIQAQAIQTGSTGSPLISGYHNVHKKAEAEFAKFSARESALLLQSGFTANLSLMVALGETHDIILIDRECHASIIDGCRLSKARFFRFRDETHLESLLSKLQPQKCAIVTESVFSMSGRMPNIKNLIKTKKQFDATLIIDDAHGLGVLGHEGKSVSGQYSESEVDIVVCPLGKAFGLFGAFICGKKFWTDQVVQFGRAYIYSTHLSPIIAGAIPTAIELVKAASKERAMIQSHLALLNSGPAAIIFFPVLSSQPPSTWDPRQSSNTRKESEISQHLAKLAQKKGFAIKAIRPPTVKQAGLRITISAMHSKADIEKLKQFLSSEKKTPVDYASANPPYIYKQDPGQAVSKPELSSHPHKNHILSKTLFIPGFSFLKNAADIQTVAARLSTQVDSNTILIGWSFGGLVALEIAKIKKVKHLYLIACSPKFVATENWPGISKPEARAFFQKMKRTPDKCITDFRAQLNCDSQDVQIEGQLAFLESALKADYRQDIPENCTWVFGEMDHLVPVGIAGLIDGETLILPNKTHGWILTDAAHHQDDDTFDLDLHCRGSQILGVWDDKLQPLYHVHPTSRHRHPDDTKCPSGSIRPHVQHSFNKAAHTYLQESHIQASIHENLSQILTARLNNNVNAKLMSSSRMRGSSSDCLSQTKRDPRIREDDSTNKNDIKVILDCGAGPRKFSSNHPHHKIIPIDFAFNSLQKGICADFNALPFQLNSIDMIFTSMALHWSKDIISTLSHWQSILKKGGLIALAIPVEGTFKSLHRKIISLGNQPVFEFLNPNLLFKNILQLGFKILEQHTTEYERPFQNISSAFKHLKKTGTTSSQKPENRLSITQIKQLQKDQTSMTLEYNILFLILESP